MQQQQLQKNDLQTLNELLLKERIAIINLRMERLSRIQQDMYPLLQRIAENAHDPDTEETNIIRQIQADIKHNRFLLKLGCKHFAIRQSVVLSLSAMTYGSNAMASVANSGPKMLSGSA